MPWELFFELLTVMLGAVILSFPILCAGVTALRFGGGAEWFMLLIYLSSLATVIPLRGRSRCFRRFPIGIRAVHHAAIL